LLSQERQAAYELWHRGDLSYKLHKEQLPIRRLIQRAEKTHNKKVGARTSRRFGKTFVFSAIASEYCLNERNIIVPYCAPSIKALKTIIVPIINELCRDCPPSLRPVLRRQDGALYFPSTESQILLVSAENGNEEKARGIKARAAFVDEGGVIKNLRYLVHDILLPTLMYSTGPLALSGTPPSTPDHYYVTFMAEAELSGYCIHKTVWDNPMLENKEILEFAEAVGCRIDWGTFYKKSTPKNRFSRNLAKFCIVEKSTTFRREFEAEIIIDPDKAVIPELSELKITQIVKDTPTPRFCNKYTVIDTGFIDYTGVVFGYYDFKRAKLVVADDLLLDFTRPGMNTEEAAKLILAKEAELWGEEKPYARFADGDLIVLNELTRHGLLVNPVRKDDIEAQVNTLRVDIAQDKLEFNPKAKNTLTHARYATWNRSRKQFERGEGMGHYDCLAALIYFVRHVNRKDNPWPSVLDVDMANDWVPSHLKGRSRSSQVLADIFKL